MIDERILLNRIRVMRVNPSPMLKDEYAIVYNKALEAVEDCVECMKKEEPIIVNPDDDLRDKLHDMEFERDFYKLHFEELLQRKMEG